MKPLHALGVGLGLVIAGAVVVALAPVTGVKATPVTPDRPMLTAVQPALPPCPTEDSTGCLLDGVAVPANPAETREGYSTCVDIWTLTRDDDAFLTCVAAL